MSTEILRSTGRENNRALICLARLDLQEAKRLKHGVALLQAIATTARIMSEHIAYLILSS